MKELATLEYIIYTMDNGIKTDTEFLTIPADVTMAEVLALDRRRKTTMRQHIIVVRNNFISDQVFQPVNSRLLLDWLNDAIEYINVMILPVVSAVPNLSRSTTLKNIR